MFVFSEFGKVYVVLGKGFYFRIFGFFCIELFVFCIVELGNNSRIYIFVKIIGSWVVEVRKKVLD